MTYLILSLSFFILGIWARNLFYSLEYFLKYTAWPKTYLDLDTIYSLRLSLQSQTIENESLKFQLESNKKLTELYIQKNNLLTKELETVQDLILKRAKQ